MFGSIVVFTIVIIPTKNHGISFHLFMSSLIFFISVIIFCVQFFVSLDKFIHRHFILFVAMVNGIVPYFLFLISHC